MWKLPRRNKKPTSSIKKTSTPSIYRDHIPVHIKRLAARLAYVLEKETLRDPKVRKLLELLPERTPKTPPFSVTAAWKADVLMGRSTSYYTLEEEALHADLACVIAAHNRNVILKEIERRRREIALEVAARFWPLRTLTQDERQKVLAFVGGGFFNNVVVQETPVREMPTHAAKKVCFSLANISKDDYTPDPEVEEIIAESYALPEDILTASLAEAGILREGERVNIAYF